ncbi:hypothetical protein LR48_Vigan09g118900 [Vigna angularis]|uniref:Uncharacterized protein n=1 Tax=Phaseolus angularis TaxID=3914 RepID=A0A0L9VBU4_PHAAN|nr:hypothetical protein LR48_Vigan09g118900 [Vigna angularis]
MKAQTRELQPDYAAIRQDYAAIRQNYAAIRQDLQEIMRMMGVRAHNNDEQSGGSQASVNGNQRQASVKGNQRRCEEDIGGRVGGDYGGPKPTITVAITRRKGSGIEDESSGGRTREAITERYEAKYCRPDRTGLAEQFEVDRYNTGRSRVTERSDKIEDQSTWGRTRGQCTQSEADCYNSSRSRFAERSEDIEDQSSWGRTSGQWTQCEADRYNTGRSRVVEWSEVKRNIPGEVAERSEIELDLKQTELSTLSAGGPIQPKAMKLHGSIDKEPNGINIVGREPNGIKIVGIEPNGRRGCWSRTVEGNDNRTVEVRGEEPKGREAWESKSSGIKIGRRKPNGRKAWESRPSGIKKGRRKSNGRKAWESKPNGIKMGRRKPNGIKIGRREPIGRRSYFTGKNKKLLAFKEIMQTRKGSYKVCISSRPPPKPPDWNWRASHKFCMSSRPPPKPPDLNWRA